MAMSTGGSCIGQEGAKPGKKAFDSREWEEIKAVVQ